MMNKETPSATAIGVAMLRAVHQLIDGEDRLLNDPVVLQLLPPKQKEYILKHQYRYFEPELMALRTSIALRSRFAEDCLEEAVKKGLKQFVILGAGLDTFAYRQPHWANHLRIIEVDHPASQTNKVLALKEANVKIPENITFLSLDFEQDDLDTSLTNAGVDLDEPIFISCLGVLVYLSKASIDKIFRFAAGLARASQFVFTISQEREAKQPSKFAARAAEAGEPWLTHFKEEEVNQQLLAFGFSEVEFITIKTIEEKYFVGSNIKLPVPRHMGLVKATI